MRGLATGQLLPDAGTIVLEKPVAAEMKGVADATVDDAIVVEQEAKTA